MKDQLHINFEEELPEGYRAAYEIDAEKFKTQLLINLAALGLAAVAAAAVLPGLHPIRTFADYLSSGSGFGPVIRWLLIFLTVSLAYVVLHELTHGLAYKLLTGRKLSFGISGSVAYCGVRGIKVYRKAAMISLVAPFAVFNIVFLTGVLLPLSPAVRLFFAIMFIVHFSGCVGDLYDLMLYLFKYRDPRTLMEDTGPKQIFYVPEEREKETQNEN